MATFSLSKNSPSERLFFKIYVSNKSNNSVKFDFQELTRGYFIKAISGSPHGFVNPNTVAYYNFDLNFNGGAPIEKGDISIITVNDVPVRMRFWSGGGQYINMLGGNNFTVTKDSSDLNEITGNGCRVSVDGGGHNMDTLDIFIQVYGK